MSVKINFEDWFVSLNNDQNEKLPLFSDIYLIFSSCYFILIYFIFLPRQLHTLYNSQYLS